MQAIESLILRRSKIAACQWHGRLARERLFMGGTPMQRQLHMGGTPIPSYLHMGGTPMPRYLNMDGTRKPRIVVGHLTVLLFPRGQTFKQFFVAWDST